MSDGLTRREFFGVTAAGAMAVNALTRQAAAAEAGAARAEALGPATRIRKVYLAKPVPTWPKPDLDVQGEIRAIEGELAKLADRLDGIQFEGGELYRVPDEVPKSAEALGNPDGLLVFNLTSTVGAHLARLCGTGVPTVLFSRPFAGHDWSGVPGLRAKGDRVICLSTSDFGEVVGACRLVRTTHLLRNTRILYVDNRPYNAEKAAKIKERLGAVIVSVGPDRVNEAYKAVADEAAQAEARDWISGAVKVVEPSEQDILNASRFYLATRRIMEEEKAQAVTVNCLGLFQQKRLPAYPCLTFCKLNDLGLTGVCEGDMDSTLTQLIFTYAFGVPGFVSDPVIDTSKNEVIHAHCVSATRMDGPSGPRAPYVIRSHMEDNQGASLQVRMRVGQVVTMAKFVNLSTMLISTGSITDTPVLDRGCRTKITTKVADAKKMLNQYASGLHRVIFYGDRVAAIRDLAGLMKFEIVEEC
jgi:hypothetical protein